MMREAIVEDPRAFSAIADVYDAEYSSQLTIRLQRRIYWQYLDRYLKSPRREVLDMNCGTGTDALHMIEHYSTRHHRVTGVDISPKMIAQFNQKALERDHAEAMRGHCSPLQHLDELEIGPFDLITSNFGGLNCLREDELRALSTTLHDHYTNSGARIIAVVMPTFCLWETAYYLTKGDVSSAFRRAAHDGVSAKIGGDHIRTYYYSPKRFAELMVGFSVVSVRPLGLFLPPSYIDNFFRRHRTLARWSAIAERMFGQFSFTANLAYNYIIELVRE